VPSSPEREAELRVGAAGVEPGADGVVGHRVGHDERPTIRGGAEELVLQADGGRGEVAALQPELGVGVAAGDAARCRRAEIIARECETEPRWEPALQLSLVPGEVPVAPGDAEPGAGRPAIVAPGEEIHPELPGPPLHLDPVQEADREERRVHRDAVHAGRHVGQAVEVVLGAGGAPRLVVDRLGAADESAAPEVDPRHLPEEVADGGGVSPLDGVTGEDDPGLRRAGPGRLDQRQHRHPDAHLLLRLEKACGLVHRVGRDRVGVGGGVFGELGEGGRGVQQESEK
jgi:hypothetical protein